MKRTCRLLALLLSLVILTSSFVFAEEGVAALPETVAEPAAEATVEPVLVPIPQPEVAPSAEPCPEITAAPTAESSVEPSVVPAPELSAAPVSTSGPMAEATPEPMDGAAVETPAPAVESSVEPTAEATPEATPEAALEPTVVPTPAETIAPTAAPDVTPTAVPEASAEASFAPTVEPTASPCPALTLDADALVLGVKEKYSLKAVSSDGENDRIAYSSENAKIAKVDQKGRITAVSIGETRILARSESGACAAVQVTVKKAPASVTASHKSANVGVGQSLQLTAAIPEGSAGTLEWTSSNSRAVSVDQTGRITALRSGVSYVKARAYNGKYASILVRVHAAPEAITLKKEALLLGVGQPCTLELKEKLPQESYSFSSDHPEIVSVNAKGAIEALAPGEAVITAATYNGLHTSCRITVVPAPQGLAFREQEITLCVNDSYTLQPLLLEGTEGVEITLKSGSRRFRLEGNTITARSVGTGTLTASTYNGHTAQIQLTCIAAPKKISFEPEEITLYLGTDTRPKLSADCSYVLESSDPAVVTAEGRTIHAVGAGDAVITATSYNKKTAALIVHVPPLPESVSLSAQALELGVGDAVSLEAILPEGQGSSLDFASSDPAVAAVDGDGRVTALSPGSAVIAVETLNGLSASCAVTVYAAPTAIFLSPAKTVRSLDEGSFRLDIRFGGAGEGGRYSITSSDPGVAAVAHDGTVQPIASGTAIITIETYNGLRASARITLGEKPAAMYFEGNICIALGDVVLPEVIFDRGCEGHALSVADETVARFEGDMLRGLVLGSTTLTAVSTSGLRASCTVSVVPPPTGLTLSHSEEKLVLGVSPSLALSATVLPDGAGSVIWRSSDSAIADVDASGLVTARAMGDCVITATTYDGLHSADCIIHVCGVLDGVKVGIDPGHQRHEDRRTETISPTSSRRKKRTSAGTSGVATGIREYETNLTIGLKLRDALQAQGATVYMTRETHDVTISNQERAIMMNEHGCDVVLRLHCNGASRRSVRGMCIYVRKTGPAQAESARAAQLVLDAMAAETGAVNLGVKLSDNYTGLNWSTVPGMLLEMGYMSNYTEDRLLNTPEYQDQLVRGMVSGICAYMGRPAPNYELQEAEQ